MLKKKIIFIYPSLYTFIQTDIKLLSENFELISVNQNWSSKLLLPINFLYQFIFLLINMHKVETILISFAGYCSFLPALLGKIFNRRVSIIVHGTDCVSFPEIEYGNLRSIVLRFLTKKSLQWASIILPVSESLVYTENNYFYFSETLKFGYNYHLSNIKTPYKVVPNGLIINDWEYENIKKVKNTFITVMTENQLIRKGADLITEIAISFPNCKFYFVGLSTISAGFPPSNIICLGRLTPKELKSWYSKTQFYLQLSSFEGFGVSICEAMLCRCIPIVSKVNFLPNIIGDSGFVLNKRNSEILIDLINLALNSDISNLEQKARKRIVDNFSSDKRKEMLIKILNE